MKKAILLFTFYLGTLFAMSLQCDTLNETCEASNDKFFLVVHGGAEPTYTKRLLPFYVEKKLKNGLFDALKAGYIVLRENYEKSRYDKESKKYLEAVQAAITNMEDNEIFNAGKGGKLTENMEVECDASIMDGANLSCGAVAGLKTVKNPILLANTIKDKTKHVFFHSSSAEKLAEKHGLETVNNEYFLTENSMDEFVIVQDRIYYGTANSDNVNSENSEISNSNGTVGAVVLDHLGNLAAGTSTGGPTYKMSGRIGDSPIIGAATYANNSSVAVSCTGVGEEIIKRSAAYDVHARYTYKDISLKQSTSELVSTFPDKTVGLITIDKNGKIEMPFNTEGMARGYVDINGKAYIEILKDSQDLTPLHYNILEEFESHFK